MCTTSNNDEVSSAHESAVEGLRRLRARRRRLGGWPKSFNLEEGESLRLSGVASYPRRLGVVTGTLYLTERRLLFAPSFMSFWEGALDLKLKDIEGIGELPRSTRMRNVLLLRMGLWLLTPWYLRVAGKDHHFYTRGDEDWLATLAAATGLKPERTNA